MGIDLNLLLNVSKFLILMIIFIVIGNMWFKIWSKYFIFSKKNQKKYLKKNILLTLVSAGIWVLLFIFMFFSFDKGKPLPITDNKEMGIYKQIQKNPNEENLETIKKEAEEKKPTILKHMDEGFEKDRKEADDYINSILNKGDKNE